MVLQINIHHTFLGGQSKEELYIGPQELEASADIASHFREAERAMFSPMKASYVDEDTLEITWRDQCCRYPVWKEGYFSTPWLSKYSKTVFIEGEEYDNDHDVKVSVWLLPHTIPLWDILKVTRDGETVSFPRESLSKHKNLEDEISPDKRCEWLKGITVQKMESSSLTLLSECSDVKEITLDCQESPEAEANGMIFSLVSLTTIIYEWDMMEDKPLRISVPSHYLIDAETDGDAAYILAECLQEQYPEALEVIAEYMRTAYKLGSSDAEEWLKDYHSDDGRYDAYC